MKTFLKFSGAIAAVLAIVAFILTLATNAVVYSYGNTSVSYAGTWVTFGHTESTLLGDVTYKLSWSALLAFIFAIVAIVILCAGVILPLLKVTALDKFAGILNLVAVILLVIAGVFVFIAFPTWVSANEGTTDNGALGAGWVIAGILYIVGGCIAIAPALANFLSKK